MKPKLSWGPRPANFDRFNDPRALYFNDEKIGEFFGHEEDGSITSIDEALTELAKRDIIDYAGL